MTDTPTMFPYMEPEPPAQQYPIVPVADLQKWAAVVWEQMEQAKLESDDGLQSTGL